MALGSLGTDTGGSIRIPAAACGLVGLKPAYGELPATGVIPLSRTLDHVGPITATVTDAWHMFQAMHDHAPGKPLSAAPVRDLRLAIPRRYFCELLDDEVRAAFEAAVETLTRAGATVVDVDIPHASLIATVYLHIVFGDAAAFHADTLDVMPERYTPNVRLRLEMARYVTAEDYVRSLDGRRTLTREVDEALTAVDAIMLPTLPIVAPPIGATTVQVGPTRETVRTVMLRLTQLFNLTGHPAISLPCRTSTSGLPCGLQLAGAAGQTRNLLQIARAIEIAMGGGPLS